jgi:hypothetical protein
LGRKDHGGVVFTPGLLRLNHVIADRPVLDEEPCLIKQKGLEGSKPFQFGVNKYLQQHNKS